LNILPKKVYWLQFTKRIKIRLYHQIIEVCKVLELCIRSRIESTLNKHQNKFQKGFTKRVLSINIALLITEAINEAKDNISDFNHLHDVGCRKSFRRCWPHTSALEIIPSRDYRIHLVIHVYISWQNTPFCIKQLFL
jgi:hypothetical protein